MARTAPAPNLVAVPGMNPGNFVAGGGGGAGGGSGKGGKGGGGKGGGRGRDGGEGAVGGAKSAPDPDKYPKCGTKSHPVDVTTGRAFTLPYADFDMNGPLYAEFLRSYSSHATRIDVGLGPGWAHSFGWKLEVHRRRIIVWSETGVAVVFPLCNPGDTVDGEWNWRLSRDSSGFVLDADDGAWRRFEPANESQSHFRLVSLRDRNHNQIALSYEGAQLRKISDSAGREHAVEWNDAGHISRIFVQADAQTTAWLRLVEYEYDEHGRLVVARDAGGFENHYGYDSRDRLTSDKDKAGLTFHFVYDKEGRCTESWGDFPGKVDESLADGLPKYLADSTTLAKGVHHCHFEYMSDGYTEVADSTHIALFVGNEHGLLDQSSDGPGTLSYEYDDEARLLSITNELGDTTTFVRDDRGRVLRMTDPLGRVTTVERDAAGLPVRVVDPSGAQTVGSRDPRGNLEYAQDAVGAVTSYSYDSRGLLTSIQTPNGGTTRGEYDVHGNLIKVIDPNGAVWHFVYDFLGREIAFVDPVGTTTRSTYSARGDLLSVEDGFGHFTYFEHDGEDNLLSQTDSGGRTTRFRYGGYNRLVQRETPTAATAKLRYNYEGELLEVYNENGEVHHLERDLFGGIVREESFDRRVRDLSLDFMGRVQRERDRTTIVCDKSYDSVGNLIEASFGDDVQRFEYDLNNRLISITTPDTQLCILRDALGGIIGEEQTVEGKTVEVSLIRDGMGDCTQVASSLGYQVQFTRSIMRTVTTTRLPGDVVTRGEDILGRTTERSFSGGGRVLTAHDAVGRVAVRKVLSPATQSARNGPQWVGAIDDGVQAQLSYTYDAAEELVQQSDFHRGTIDYEYDADSRVVSARKRQPNQQDTVETFSYDPADNLFEQGGSSRRYDVGGRLAQKGEWQYEYGGDGNLLYKSRPSADGENFYKYTWTGAGLLAAVKCPDGRQLRFIYDGLARRVLKEVTRSTDEGEELESTTRYVWLRDQLLHEITTEYEGRVPSTLERTYLFEEEDATPIAHRERRLENDQALSDRWVHYLNSPIGAPQRLVNSDGSIAAVLDWKVWGEASELPGATATTPLRYLGQIYDPETELSYNRFRYYSPGDGRFISADPSGLIGSMNPFACSGNPLSWVDQFGLDWNYRLRDANRNVYYHGRASDKTTPAQVMYRHNKNQEDGLNGVRRFEAGDQLEVVTPVGTDKDVSRGIEQQGIEEDGTKTGVRACKKKGIKKEVRGNVIAGSNNPEKAGKHKVAAHAYLQGGTASALPVIGDPHKRK